MPLGIISPLVIVEEAKLLLSSLAIVEAAVTMVAFARDSKPKIIEANNKRERERERERCNIFLTRQGGFFFPSQYWLSLAWGFLDFGYHLMLEQL